MKSVLVLGGNGFVGSAICKEAISHDWKVTCLSRGGKPRYDLSADWISKVNWVKGDATNLNDVGNEMQNVSAVIHCIGILYEFSGNTFAKFNRDSAIIPASEAISKYPNIKHFLFISPS